MSTIIEAKNLNLGYNDDLVIKDATFNINAKEFVFITGASGSGKSTILSSFFGYLGVKSGLLNVFGINMQKASKSRINHLRRSIGIVFQDYKLIKEWNIERNVMLPMVINGYKKEVCKSQVEKLLVHIKLSHKANKFPLELSGGEQQRVAMAREIGRAHV